MFRYAPKRKLPTSATFPLGSLGQRSTVGVSNIDHHITDIGQDLNHINRDFPPIWDLLSAAGLNVGVFGSLQSYPAPKRYSKLFIFHLIPLPRAQSFPSDLDVFQAFNLSMVRANGRNVSGGLPFRSSKEFLVNSFALGLTPATMLSLARQLISEKTNPDRLVRRRTSHAEIAFDLFFHQLKSRRPDVSFSLLTMWHLACTDIGQRYFRKTIPRAVLTSSGGLGGREKSRMQ